MAHPRELVRDTVVALLIAANTAAGARVQSTRIDPIKASDLPMISVYTRDEDVADDSSKTAPRELTRMLQLEIAAWVRHSDAVPVERAMDNIAAQIEAAMDGNRYLTMAGTITAVDPATDQLTIPAHGFTGTVAPAFVASSATVPTGSYRGVPYHLIIVDANTVKLAASLDDALAGTAVDLTDAGSGKLQLLVSAAADTILESSETDIQETDGKSDPLVGRITLTYTVTYRTSPATDAPAVLPDFTLINAEHRIVGATDANAAYDQFNPRT